MISWPLDNVGDSLLIKIEIVLNCVLQFFLLTASKTQKVILIREFFILMSHSDMTKDTIQAIPLASKIDQNTLMDFGGCH